MLTKALKTTKSEVLSKKLAMENQLLGPNGFENVSNMSQSVRNIIVDDQKHILDLNKSHKGLLKVALHALSVKEKGSKFRN